MKREHLNNISTDIPFAHNLIFHAPLTELDLTDHVSGVSPEFGTGSCTYDDNMSAYKFIANSPYTNQHCLVYNIPDGIDFKESENYNFSIYTKIFVVNCNVTVDFAMLGTGVMNNHDGDSVFSIGEVHRYYTSSSNPVPLGQWYELCMTKDPQILCFYIDKSLSRTAYWGSSVNYCICMDTEKAVRVGANKYISIGSVFYDHTFTAYVKDLRIYDRVLSASEVAQL